MITIGNGTEYISIDVTRHFPVSEGQPWEAYFLRVSGKSAFLCFDIDNVDAQRSAIERFYLDLRECYRSLSGECVAKSFDYADDFSLSLCFEKTGRITVSAVISDTVADNQCRIRFFTDQTFISSALKQMEQTFSF